MNKHDAAPVLTAGERRAAQNELLLTAVDIFEGTEHYCCHALVSPTTRNVFMWAMGYRRNTRWGLFGPPFKSRNRKKRVLALLLVRELVKGMK